MTTTWHARRRRGLGGSDVAAVFGVGRWSSPGELWRIKTGRSKGRPGNAFMTRGTRLESAVLARYELETGVPVSPGGRVVHPRWDDGVRLQGNLDGRLPDGSIWEAKTTGPATSTAADVRAGRAPLYYATQLGHYCACAGVTHAVLATLVGEGEPENCELVVLDLELPAELLVLIEDVCARWWAEHVVADVQPPRGRHPRAEELEALVGLITYR